MFSGSSMIPGCVSWFGDLWDDCSSRQMWVIIQIMKHCSRVRIKPRGITGLREAMEGNLCWVCFVCCPGARTQLLKLCDFFWNSVFMPLNQLMSCIPDLMTLQALIRLGSLCQPFSQLWFLSPPSQCFCHSDLKEEMCHSIRWGVFRINFGSSVRASGVPAEESFPWLLPSLCSEFPQGTHRKPPWSCFYPKKEQEANLWNCRRNLAQILEATFIMDYSSLCYNIINIILIFV